MAITVPTTEFTGMLNDVIPFALDQPDFPIMCCVRVAWDGEQLAAQAHNGQHMAWSRWHPDDDPAEGEAQESLFDPWGSNDDPWSVVIPLAHAKETTKLYKLPDKHMWTPLQLTIRPDGLRPDGALRITRPRVPGLMGIETTVDRSPAGKDFPDFEKVFAKADRPEAVERIAFNAELLAHFGTVRPRGPMEMSFNGPRGAAMVRIGERFTGGITPTRVAERKLQAVA